MHMLDNAVWHALTGPHATVAERARSAARYVPEVSVFGAIADEPTAEAWDDLRDLVGPGGAASLARRDVTVPGGWSELFRLPCRQMVLPDAVPMTDRAAENDNERFGALDATDVPEMLALVERTKPGPFMRRTIELGTYLGVRAHGSLVAMAGERLHPPGFTEISAVCTDTAYRGRGLGSRLVGALVQSTRARGETPFLHLTMENEPAHRLYAALGFETRLLLDVVAVRAPD